MYFCTVLPTGTPPNWTVASKLSLLSVVAGRPGSEIKIWGYLPVKIKYESIYLWKIKYEGIYLWK
jgi:hypothetical protein